MAAAVVALSVSCATGRAVPRPFPGASGPPPADEPPQAETTVMPPTTPPETVLQPPILGRPGRVVLPPTIPGLDAMRAELVATALSLRGIRYRNGGSDPSGFDCSGFVQWVFARHARRLPRETRDQYLVGDSVPLDLVQPGDLVFFETVSRGASHVGVAIGSDQFVHAPSTRGVVRVERYSLPYWASRFVGARRVVAPT